jgi:predicted RNA-binding Zn-ribbon protein involved in translation (DUF1610 family)
MAKSGDEAVLVCLRVIDARVVIPGSTKDTCTDCGEKIWVSAASRKLAVEKQARFLCMACANARAEKDKEVTVEPITEEQWKEFRDAIERG